MASLPHTVPQEVLDMLMVPSTATLSSALKSVCGIDNAFMHGVAPCKPGCHMAGPADLFSGGGGLVRRQQKNRQAMHKSLSWHVGDATGNAKLENFIQILYV